MRIRVATALVALLALTLASCGSSASKSASPGQSQPAAPTTLSVPANPPGGGEPATAEPVWLCRPGATPDPCTANLNAESVTASGATSQVNESPAGNSPFDCFYVYPTVSTESGDNANLAVQAAEVSVAEQQASRFSSACRVWAPMYRQVTVGGLFTAGVSGLDVAYQSLLADWSYYLAHDNDGRPIIFIGHSQGAAMLIRLLAEQVDDNPGLLNASLSPYSQVATCRFRPGLSWEPPSSTSRFAARSKSPAARSPTRRSVPNRRRIRCSAGPAPG